MKLRVAFEQEKLWAGWFCFLKFSEAHPGDNWRRPIMTRASQDAFWRQEGDILWIGNDLLRLAFSTANGHWLGLIFQGIGIISDQADHLPVDINLDEEWQSHLGALEFESFRVEESSGGLELHLEYRHPLLDMDAVYFLPRSCALVHRRIEVIYRASEIHRLRGFQYSIPQIVVDKPEDCIFSAPGELLPAQLPFRDQAAIQPSQDRLDRKYWDGLLDFGQFATAPDIGLGLLIVFNPKKELGIFSWFYSETEPCTLFTYGHGNSISMHYQHRVEGYLKKGERVISGTQYIALQSGGWSEALGHFQGHWASIGVNVPKDIPSWIREAVIYETHPIIHGGFEGLRRKLPSIADLGCNVLYLCPIWDSAEVTEALHEQHKSVIWRLDPTWQRSNIPHRIRDFYKLDPRIGAPEDLRRMVSEAHRLGIRVLFDLVFHGVTKDSNLVREHPDWFELDLNGEMFSSHEWLPNYSWDWSNKEVHDFVVEFGLHNVREYDIDGYRVDAALAKESNWDLRAPYRASHAAFGGLSILRTLRREMRSIKSDAILLSEESGPVLDTICDVCNDDAIQRMLFDAARNRINAQELLEWLRVRALATPPASMRVWSIENHNAGRRNPSPIGLRGSPMARVLFALCALAGDVPLIWANQEKGQEEAYSQLLRLRRENPSLRLGRTIFEGIACPNPQVFACYRGASDLGVIVAANLSSDWQRTELDLANLIAKLGFSEPFRTRWIFPRGWIGQTIAPRGTALSFELLPYQAYALEISMP
jgi:hypothetical protein